MTSKKTVVIASSILLITLLLISTQFGITSLVVHIFDSFVTSGNIEMSIPLENDSTPPSIIIDSPTNTSYSTGTIDINWTASDSQSGLDTVWYNLNRGENTILTSNITTTLSNGDYTIYIFANDSVRNENGTEKVSFNINVSRLINVIYARYDGSTTNFSAMNDEELGNITNLTLEITSYGRIVYDETINISQDTDLDTYADISDNNIFLDSETLSYFNKPATLWLYNLGFTNPRILRDGSVCSSSICALVDYSGGILEFNVTGFTNYSAEETPTEAPTPTAEAAGAGRAFPKKITFPRFEVTPEVVKIGLKQGETKSQTITIENTEDLPLEGVVDITEVKDFVVLSDYAFELNAKQAKNITAVFTASTTTEPDVYTGRIFVRTKDLTRTIIVIIEVESRKPLFDVNMSIPLEYKKITAGENVVGNIIIVNIGDILPVDVNIDYVIKDLRGDVVGMQQETIAAKDVLSLTKRMETPKDLELGDYVFYVKVYYDGNFAIASDLFSIISLEEKKPSWLAQQLSKISYLRLIIIIFVLVIVVISIVLVRKKRGKLPKQKDKKRISRKRRRQSWK